MWKALTMTACVWLALACGMNVDDRMVRRYAECMVDPNTTLHRQLLRGEVAMAEIRADYGRYCE